MLKLNGTNVGGGLVVGTCEQAFTESAVWELAVLVYAKLMTELVTPPSTVVLFAEVLVLWSVWCRTLGHVSVKRQKSSAEDNGIKTEDQESVQKNYSILVLESGDDVSLQVQF